MEMKRIISKLNGNHIISRLSKNQLFANKLEELYNFLPYHLGKGKPVVQLTPEGDIPTIAQVTSWKQDSAGNYNGFFIKTFGLSGQSVSANVHYAVFGKQEIPYLTGYWLILVFCKFPDRRQSIFI